MTPKFNILARQLNRSLIADTSDVENPQARMMTSYKAECDREAKALVKVVEDKLSAANAEISILKAQLAEAGRETTRQIKEYGYKMDALKETHKKELEGMGVKHYEQNGMVHAQLEAKTRECAKECQDKVKAETELAGANRTIARLEQSVAKLQNDLKAKPVVAPAAQKMNGMKMRVTQRDENGNIVEAAIIPLT